MPKSTIFSVLSGRNHRFLGSTSTFWEVNAALAQEYNMVTQVRIEHATSAPESDALSLGHHTSLPGEESWYSARDDLRH